VVACASETRLRALVRDQHDPIVATLHDDEFDLSTALVRQFVRSLPDLADLPIEPLDMSGSSNALFRLGPKLLIRLPRRPSGSESIDKEARWLPHVAAQLTAPIPPVVAVGEPGAGYPERWLVTRWIEGRLPQVPWSSLTAGSSRMVAEDLAHFVAELGDVPVPPEARSDPALSWYRGRPLADLVEDFHVAADQCRRIPDLHLDLGRARRIWDNAVAADRSLTPRLAWYHGDLLAENLLVRDGRLAAVLDFGGLSIGGPHVDLIVAWEVLDDAGREAFRTTLGLTDAAWSTSMGWALLTALITFPYYWDSMPLRCARRKAMAAAVLAEG
jgi:aminoglycoside phosphotransferase (APT) family kinase protein